MSLSCRLGHRQTSTPKGFIYLTTYNCSISSKSGIHPPGYVSSTPLSNPHYSFISYTIPLVCKALKLLSLSSHPWNQSISTMADLLSNYPQTHPHIPFQQSYHSSFFQYGQTIREHFHQSFHPPASLLHTTL